MAKYIIGYGYEADADIVEADSLDAALTEARNRSAAVGVDAEGMDDCAYARAYDPELARELGLAVLDEDDASRAAWKSAAPWR